MYLEVEELKDYLNITRPVDDEIIESMCLAAQAYIEHKTNRVFEVSADSIRYFDATKLENQRLLRFGEDLISITTVVNGDGSTIASSNYFLSYAGHLIYELKLKGSTGLYFTYEDDPEEAIAVTGKWAYSLTPPQDIIQATRRLASYLFWQKDNANDLDRPFIIGQVTSLPAALPRDVERLIAKYVRKRILA